MLILGAGLAGCIAGVLNQEAVIYEAGSGKTQHQAVLRFRSPAVGEAVGIPFKKVKVYKNIYFNGEFVVPNIQHMNLYSNKVTGSYYDRSIANLKTEERWIAPEGFHEMLVSMCEGRVFFNHTVTDKAEFVEHNTVISTIPIDVMAKILGIDLFIERQKTAIYVTKIWIPDSDLQQTIYYPDDKSAVYRATMTGDMLRVEAMKQIYEADIQYVYHSFGISGSDMDSDMVVNHKQPIGKLLPFDEQLRRTFVREWTEKYRIYSLGRFATWRNILLDDVLKDIHQIRKMVNQDQYSNRLENI